MSTPSIYYSYDTRTYGHGFRINGERHPAPPSLFRGTAEESAAPFVYQISLHVNAVPGPTFTVEHGHAFPEQNKVVLRSSFLRGAAPDWFLALVRANAPRYCARANAQVDEWNRRALADWVAEADQAPHYTWHGTTDYELTGFPFVTEELATFGGLAKALSERFDGRHGGAEVDERSVTPTEAGSDATLAWE